MLAQTRSKIVTPLENTIAAAASGEKISACGAQIASRSKIQPQRTLKIQDPVPCSASRSKIQLPLPSQDPDLKIRVMGRMCCEPRSAAH